MARRARLVIAMAMIFVPSRDGISHNELEDAAPQNEDISILRRLQSGQFGAEARHARQRLYLAFLVVA